MAHHKDNEDIIPRKIPAQNVVIKLMKRELHALRRPNCHIHFIRNFYQNIFPNFTIMQVEKPPCFLRKFSLDGRYFIAFSSDQTSVEVYVYKGPSALATLLANKNGDHIGVNPTDRDKNFIRRKVFDTVFKLKHCISVAPAGQHLNRECSLFTDDKKYVIVGSASFIPEDTHPRFFDVYRNNESVFPNPRSPLENYTLHIIDMESGFVCDRKSFKIDKIFLSHNQGLYLFKNILAILSVQQQLIYILQISDRGTFIPVRTIGRFCYDDDKLLLSPHCYENIVSRGFRDITINSLKHRFLVYLYKRAVHISEKTRSPLELRRFYQYFDQFASLRMWKMQILDEDHLLIKYASMEVVTLRASEPNSQSSFFVIYNINTTEVIGVYENTSQELLKIFEDYCDFFRNSRLDSESQFTSSPSSSIYARLQQQRFKKTIISAKFGGSTEATKRLLAQLPISSQSYCTSPYLDLSLFSYDDKWVSVMERPKACGDHPIRFYSRESGLLKFHIYAGIMGRNPPPSARRLVAFTFHPTDPFVISVQRTNAEYVVNFHVRHIETI